MRSVLFPPCCFLLTLLASFTCSVLSLVGAKRLAHKAECLWGTSLVRCAGVRLEADLDALDPDGTYVFMANHQSNMDIPILFAALRRYDFRFLAKENLFAIPFFGAAMRRVGHVAIDRQNSRKAMASINAAAGLLGRGMGLLIFPEGTRSMDFSTLQEFKTGGVIVALKSGAKVAPLVLVGSGDVLPKHARTPKPGRVRLRALPPLDPSTVSSLKDREAFKNDLWAQMERAYQEMRS